jgi:hopanoid biosynthesis associated protein HpnK
VRRLIINADDFGLTSSVNRAILESHQRGVVTSATLMAKGASFDEAIQLAQSVPRLSLGCHVVLVDGSPILSPSQIPSLVKSHNAGFRERLSSFARGALTKRLDPDQIEAEAAAQIRKLLSAGVTVTHVDTHKHTHMFPHVLRPVLRAANTCGVRAIRNPFETVSFSLVAARPRLWKRYFEVNALNGFARTFRQSVQEAGLRMPDGSVGVVATGVLDDRLFRLLIEHLPEGTWEFVCHPGYNDSSLQGIRTSLRESRKKELDLLTSSAVRDWLAQYEVQLISYGDFVQLSF